MFYLAIEDAKFQKISIAGLCLFIIFSAITYFLNGHNTAFSTLIFACCLLFAMACFSMRNQLGAGDVWAAIGCFLLTEGHFIIVMALAYLICILSLLIQQKRQTGFIPYMLSSMIITSLLGGVVI